jgi:hypothetical protein
VPTNLYCIAEEDSLLDFSAYKRILLSVHLGSLRRLLAGPEFIEVDPSALGLKKIEGALQTHEKHIIVDELRAHFAKVLGDRVECGRPPGKVDDAGWDLTIDCTFCAHEGYGIDRFEACLTVLLEGLTDRAVTVMDGPFPSLYPWQENKGLCSLTSARYTPLARRITWKDARYYLDHELSRVVVEQQTKMMISQMAEYYPAIADFRVVDHRFAIRALPRSAADARLIDIVVVGERAIRVRAGKLDAIFAAEQKIKEAVSHHTTKRDWLPRYFRNAEGVAV